MTLISRYPLLDLPLWKRQLTEQLLADGATLSILYSRSTLRAQAGFGLGRVLERLAASAPEPTPARQVDPPAAGLTRWPLSGWARRNGLAVHAHASLRGSETLATLGALRPQVCVLVGADLVPRELLEVPTIATINPHYGLLPHYRGMNVTEWTVWHDDPVGVTVHVVDAGVDTGDLLLRERVPVDPVETLSSLRAKHQQLAARMLRDAVHRLAHGTAVRTPQDPRAGRQFYRMHDRLLAQVRAKLANGSYHRRLS